ncbi:MAG: amidase, partial [Acetobacteraceae bacterium]|nr:amidase [Acetobacteraceae bacterium]
MRDDDLLFMPAVRTAALIRRRQLSPVEYLKAVLAAAGPAQARLNCFAVVMAEAAMAAARAAEQAVMDGMPLGPLHGVPVTIKDLLDVTGVPTRHGSAIFADAGPAQADEAMVARLRAAGAILWAKTTTPEFGVKGLTDGPAFGITRNPWDPAR